jgi:signal peptidase II
MKKALAIVFAVLLADQGLKFWVKTHMMLGQEFEIFPWFIIHFTENMGMAFGMELGGDWGKLALSLFRMLAAVGLAYYLHIMVKKGASNGAIVAISLVFAGAVGNIIDGAIYGVLFSESYGQVATMFPADGGYAPFLYGRVVDMFYFPLVEGHFPSWFPMWANEHFLFFRPVFNIADAAITCGMALIIILQKEFFGE